MPTGRPSSAGTSNDSIDAHEEDQDRREDRRPRQLERDAPRHLPDARAAHRRRLLERRVHGAERRAHQQERHRRVVQRRRPRSCRPSSRCRRAAARGRTSPAALVDDADLAGCASRIQATVKRIDGMTSGMSDSAKKNDLNGVLVRSFIHASAGPDDEREERRAEGEPDRVPEQPRASRSCHRPPRSCRASTPPASPPSAACGSFATAGSRAGSRRCTP